MGYFGSSAFAGVKAGSSNVTKIYVGSTLAWSAAAPPPPAFTGFQTGFESGDTQPTAGTVGVASTTQAYEGTQSWYVDNNEIEAGDGTYLNTGLATDKRYDCYSLWMRPSQDLMDGSGSWRMPIAGTATDFNTAGWTIYTRTNGIAVAGNSGTWNEASSFVVNVPLDTWHHFYVQVDWLTTTPNKATANPEFSLWINGTVAIAATTFPSAHNGGFGTPANGFDTWQLAKGLFGGGFFRWYDKLICNVSDTAPVPAGATTPAAIEAALLSF